MAANQPPIANRVTVTSERPKTLLAELRQGQLFRYNADGPIYMKVALYSDTKHAMVNLNNGDVYYNEAMGSVFPIASAISLEPGL